MTTRRVGVVGGGLAGITAALRSADEGFAVTLFEARPRLGGLTHSFRRDGLWIDNGQHVFLRCCTAYQSFLERLGVADQVTVQDRLDVPVRSELDRRDGRLRRTALPAPLHLGATLARYRWLSRTARARVVRAALALGRVDRTDPETDGLSFGDWLTAHGQDQRAIETVWDLIGIATLNAPAERASLALAATVFQLGLLESAAAADIGWSLVPLQELHGDAALRALTAAGVRVRTRSRVREVVPAGDGWTVDDAAFDDVVLAVPPAAAERLAPAGAIELEPGWADELGSTPIVNLHAIYDRVVLGESFFAAVDSPLQWVFDRTRQAGLKQGQYIAVSLSAADDIVDTPVPVLRDRLLPHLERLLRITAEARLLDFFVTRERHATFRQRPGTAGLRASARTALPGLYLAGAWTDTGWPATMEGAVRSGEAAAAALLARRPAERREAVL
ncbi:squalene-associated FAD-dependent desaturase [Kribbella sp. VKM Ac-2569]|uniref:hydroxysqualene dehydroxylase HpnE n=1 Tax=Kribbella sp. VKM Ac-2569 TaxID=2512220 RepID=UPI00102CC66B|nr:hydroxysqualene dehydroxylase HpnE [Kribbella sp. VKM Ac-2569]RZT16883.1 squalene-associated FAD-dependent desaturase [Kribbella sp. VKM Ac-2569]